MKKKILITGSSGFIGSAITKFLSKDYDIIGVDRKPILDELKSIENYKHYQYDIVEQLPDESDIYAVIHLAANPGVRSSHEKFENVCRDNILGIQKVFKKCIEDYHPNRILFASSSSIYGDNGKDGHASKESESVSPRSPYAMSKCANEDLAICYHNCDMLGITKTVALRIFTVYGENQRDELAIRSFANWMLKDEPIIVYGDGTQSRDFLHINDTCRAIKLLLECNLPNKYDVVNLGSGEAHTINNIIYSIATYLGKKVTIDYQPRNCYDVDKTLADITRINKLTGWKPEVVWKDGLKAQIEWQTTHLI